MFVSFAYGTKFVLDIQSSIGEDPFYTVTARVMT